MVTKKSLFSWVFERFLSFQLLLFLLIVLTIFLRVFPLEMQKRIVNSAIAFKNIDVLFLYCGLYIGAVVLAGLLKYLINVLESHIGQRILLDMRAALYEHMLRLPLSFFRKTPAGTAIASLTSELSVVGDFMGGALAVPVINILTLLAFLAYLTYLSPLLAALSFAVYPIEILVVPLLQKRFNRLNQNRIALTRSMSNVIGEAVSGMHEIHGNVGNRLENDKLNRFALPLFHVRSRMNVYKYLIKFVNNLFQGFGPFILFLIGGYLTIQGRFDLGALVAFLSAYEKLYDPWKELMDYYQSLQDTKVRYRQVMDCFDEKPEFDFVPKDGREPYDLEGSIEVKDLSLTVDEQIHVLNGVSVSVEPGRQLALVGLSGSGKSTLAMIVGQLYNYTGGHALIDGKEIKTLSKMDVGRNVGFVAQHPFIFDGTIRENILYGVRSLNPGPDEAESMPEIDELLKTIDRVGMTEDALKMGLDTVLTAERHRDLAEKLVRVRETFSRRWRADLEREVDFIDVDRFQHHTGIAENITFGYPNRPSYAPGNLPGNPSFGKFLRETKLLEPLLELGEEVARQTEALLEGLQDQEFLFDLSPIGPDEMEVYGKILERIESRGNARLSKKDRESLLGLALRFVPALHKMVALSPSFEEQILGARKVFMERTAKEDPGAFSFYSPGEYIYAQSVLSNVLFGDPRSDHPHALERIRQRVVELLEEESLLEDIIGVGMDFSVGSKGDRLSGGQKQKIAIARALLKDPKILILDEATASLDNASQNRIQALLNSELKGKKTLVSVVHRLEMVKDYDQIAVMKAGKIVEIGPYERLMAGKGLFYELVHGSK